VLNPVQANWANSELDLQFGSKDGAVPGSGLMYYPKFAIMALNLRSITILDLQGVGLYSRSRNCRRLVLRHGNLASPHKGRASLKIRLLLTDPGRDRNNPLSSSSTKYDCHQHFLM